MHGMLQLPSASIIFGKWSLLFSEWLHLDKFFHFIQQQKKQFISSYNNTCIYSTMLSSDLLTEWFKGLVIVVFGFRLTSTVLEAKIIFYIS